MAEELQRWLDQEEIRRVRRLWAYSRDLGEWDVLHSLFHPDATVHVLWFSGPYSEFISRVKQQMEMRQPECHGKHWLGNMRSDIRGSRAVQETDVQILLREYLDDCLFDIVAYGRFYDLFEKRDGAWKIFKMTCIYEKDRADPVLPGPLPGSLFDGLSIAGPGSETAFATLRLKQRGRKVVSGVIAGSEEEKHLREEGRRWLSTAD